MKRWVERRGEEKAGESKQGGGERDGSPKLTLFHNESRQLHCGALSLPQELGVP